MKRRKFLSLLVGAAFAPLFTKLPKAQPLPVSSYGIPPLGIPLDFTVDSRCSNWPTLQRDSIRITFPAPVPEQDRWALYGIGPNMEGSIGAHYQIPIKEVKPEG
jgi:hypothetical protein